MTRDPVGDRLRTPVAPFEGYLTPYNYGGPTPYQYGWRWLIGGIPLFIAGLVVMVLNDVRFGAALAGMGGVFSVIGYYLVRQRE